MKRRLSIWLLLMAGLCACSLVVRYVLVPPPPIHWFEHTRHGGELYDPIEDDPKVQPLLDAAGHEADEELAARGIRNGFGYCNIYWPTKKRILKDKYGIDWRTPAEMNPDIIWD